jgi:hypothetical protein
MEAFEIQRANAARAPAIAIGTSTSPESKYDHRNRATLRLTNKPGNINKTAAVNPQSIRDLNSHPGI